MYSIVLAAFLTPAYEAPALGRRHGCRGGCIGYSTGCYGCSGGCYGCGGGYGGGGCYGCGGGFSYGGCGGGFSYGGCGGMVYPSAAGSGGCGGMAYPSAAGSGGGGGMAYPGTAGSAGGSGGSGTGSSGGSYGADTEVTKTLKTLKASLDELRKEQAKFSLEQLKQTAENLRLKSIEQQIGELRRGVEGLNRGPRTVPLPMPLPLPGPKPVPELPNPRTGKVMLRMPANALLLVNDKPIPVAASFTTPILEPGKEYVCEFEAVLVQDGESVNRVKRVVVRAGEVVRLAYEDMEPPHAKVVKLSEEMTNSAHVTVRVPVGARLTVHGVDCPLTSNTRSFDTPALTPGQDYFYDLKARVMRDGQPVTQTRRVTFRAGQRVTVSFENLVANNRTAQ